jgi:hypothetical protein
MRSQHAAALPPRITVAIIVLGVLQYFASRSFSIRERKALTARKFPRCAVRQKWRNRASQRQESGGVS